VVPKKYKRIKSNYLIDMYNTVFDSYIKEKNPDQNLTSEEKERKIKTSR
jgi:transcription elongation factor Elf1